MRRKNILLLNDDGLRSPGLRALALALSPRHELTIVAPSTQKSWIGKASSYHRSLPFEHTVLDGQCAVMLEGTPADCAVGGIYHFCPRKPDFLVSGINVGANVGDSFILSSGTVGGALEGVLAGVPSLACGLEFSQRITKQMEFNPTDDDVAHFAFAAQYTAKAVDVLLGLEAQGRPLLFNLNFGEGANKKSRLVHTVVARYNYGCFLEMRDGQLYHGGTPKDASGLDSKTDIAAVRDGNISFSILELFRESPATAELAARFLSTMGS